MPFARGNSDRRLAQSLALHGKADHLSTCTYFNSEECRNLLMIYEKLSSLGKLDRLKFREILHTTFDITDDVMLDLTFRSFDRNFDGLIDETEWVKGISTMLRGSIDELTEFCYFVYDMNGDRSLAREELSHCLKGCIYQGYGVDDDEIEDAEKDIVELAMKLLDVNHDGQITFSDFSDAVHMDPLLIQAAGPCLPPPSAMATFLAIVTENVRAYSPSWGSSWIIRPKASKYTLASKRSTRSKLLA